MMNDVDKFKEKAALKFFGRSRSLAIGGSQCVSCGKFNLEFRDELSCKEYSISGLCQRCQDFVFGEKES